MRLLRQAMIAAALVVAAVSVGACSDGPDGGPDDAARLIIETRSGPVSFMVEVADTDETRRKGLMFREELAADSGMLFDFESERVASMWMRSTPLPLDMIFITAQGRVAHIAENTVPYSEAIISSRYPVLAVLEVNAGKAAETGVAVGDRVQHPMFARDGNGP